MKESNQLALAESSSPAERPVPMYDALSPLNTIRTETVLSRFPVHNLAKKGKVDIRIVRHTGSGAVQLKWEVSFSDRYGQPRQLAYKLDTLIVNRRLDEEGRPLPALIRIGSLREICKQLGMQESGKNTRDVRNAFLQNATAFINAQIVYRAGDGAERRLEAGFTRYGVVFTGETLPDGRLADAVYITLNAPYRDVVNTAPVRPLDYDYLKALTPAAQRFYEVVSFRMYAALKNGWPVAKLSYSDYCAFSAQQRYFDHEHFRVQMYKIHKPHLESGYIKSITIDAVTDEEGHSDWLMNYVPGPKARSEFRTFTEKEQKAGRSQNPGKPDGKPDLKPRMAEPASPLLNELVTRGIGQSRAAELLSRAETDGVLDQIEWGDFLIKQAAPGVFRNPPGFYIWLIAENIVPPPHFETTRRRRQREEEQRGTAEEELRLSHLQMKYEEYQCAEIERYMSSLSPAEYAERLAGKRKELSGTYQNLPQDTLSDIARIALSIDLRSSVPTIDFEEFCSRSH
jgi:hypothetical protein